ncbi:MAG: GH3 auxin-responsive promoter family protein [Treponema sp.]|jgi:hypothetical protein|nr:GH3 auxin-responsive promoter family protein [Treponema sp.]
MTRSNGEPAGNSKGRAGAGAEPWQPELALPARPPPDRQGELRLARNTKEFFDEYVRDIENGTLSSRFPIPGSIRAVLEARLKLNSGRVEELRQLKVRHGVVLPKHYRPRMQIVNVWMCGNTAVHLEKIRDPFPDHRVFHAFG